MRFYRVKLCMSALLSCLIFISCDKVVGPSVTDTDLEIIGGFVQLTNESTKPAGTFDWGGDIFNRSKFQVTAGVTIELINVDNAIFYTSSEHLVTILSRNSAAFTIEENGLQVPLPVFSSIKNWNLKIRLVAFK